MRIVNVDICFRLHRTAVGNRYEGACSATFYDGLVQMMLFRKLPTFYVQCIACRHIRPGIGSSQPAAVSFREGPFQSLEVLGVFIRGRSLHTSSGSPISHFFTI